jgi:hypothetical protein
MRFLNTIFRQASGLDRGLGCCRSSPKKTEVQIFVQPIAVLRNRKILRAQWILEGEKLRLAWMCDDDSEAVPLARALPFNAIFITVRREYEARPGMRWLAFMPGLQLGLRWAA